MAQILANNLWTFRMMRKMSREALAELCKISARQLGKIEAGRCNTSLRTIEKIANGTGLCVAQLLSVKGVKAKK